MSSMFKKAVRKNKKFKLLLGAPSGAGKTMGALMIAKGFGGRIAVLDTERDSASMYASKVALRNGGTFVPPEFDTVNLVPPYTPEAYIEIIEAAVAEGYDTLIIDSLSHEWTSTGGILEQVDPIAKTSFRGNTYAAWGVLTPRHNKLISTILQSDINIICTCRQKVDTEQQDVNGRKTVVKLGMKNEQRDGIEYEFDIALDIIHVDNLVSASKDRTGLFVNYNKPLTEEVGVKIREWFQSGKEFSSDDKITPQDAEYLSQFIQSVNANLTGLLNHYKIESIQDMSQGDYEDCLGKLRAKQDAAQQAAQQS